MFNFSLLVSAITLLTLDFIFLNLIKVFLERQIQSVQGSAMKINFLGAALPYVFMIAGLNYFIIKPHKSVSDAFFLGLVINGVYETTNYALLKNWSIFTVVMDTLWGGVLFASTTYIVNLLRNIF
jgi:uncharacterized membrane protein